MALALPEDGTLIACDVSDEWTAIGRRYWKDAGVAQKIDLRLAPALETLDRLVAEGGAGTFDMAFIDADKTNYDSYYEHVLTMLRPQGIVAIDMSGGAAASPMRKRLTPRPRPAGAQQKDPRGPAG